jgi:hypothetical protein
MPLVPMKQTIRVVREGEDDKWGNSVAPVEFTLKCAINEGTKMVSRSSGQSGPTQITSETVVSSAQIFLDKFANIRIDDEIYYTDESGEERYYKPINIERKRLNGKAILTIVNV